jgi:hypothetical protein
LWYVVWVAESDSTLPVEILEADSSAVPAYMVTGQAQWQVATDTLVHTPSEGSRVSEVWWRLRIAGGARVRFGIADLSSSAIAGIDTANTLTVNGGTSQQFAPVAVSAALRQDNVSYRADLSGLFLDRVDSLRINATSGGSSLAMARIDQTPGSIMAAVEKPTTDSLSQSAELELAWSGGRARLAVSDITNNRSTPGDLILDIQPDAVFPPASGDGPLESFGTRRASLRQALSAVGVVALSKIAKTFQRRDTLTLSQSGYWAKRKDVSGLYTAYLTPGSSVTDAIAQLKQDPDITSVLPNLRIPLNAYPTNDPALGVQWALADHNTTVCGVPCDVNSGINVAAAWDVTMGDPTIHVGIIDSGIKQGLQEFMAGSVSRVQYGPSFDGSVNDDTDGHGTSVAGILTANANNGYGIAGVAPGITPVSLKVHTENDYAPYAFLNGLFQATTWAMDAHLPLLNMSLGALYSDIIANDNYNSHPGRDAWELLGGLCRDAYMMGTFIVASAGNIRENKTGQGPLWTYSPNYPAAYRKYVFAVGASLWDGQVWTDSLIGGRCDVNNAYLCFRSNIDQTGLNDYHWLDAVAPGAFIATTNFTTPYDYLWDLTNCSVNNPVLKGFRATSAAAPFVTGTAALLKSAMPGLIPAGIDTILKATARDVEGSGWNSASGYGIVNAGAALSLVSQSDLVSRFETMFSVVDSEQVSATFTGFAYPTMKYRLQATVHWYREGHVWPLEAPRPLVWIDPSGTVGLTGDHDELTLFDDTHTARIVSADEYGALLETYIYRTIGNSWNVGWFPARLSDARIAFQFLIPHDALVGVDDEPFGAPLVLTVRNSAMRGRRPSLEVKLGSPGRLSIAVYDVSGRKVNAFSVQSAAEGQHVFELGSPGGGALRPGVYFVRCQLGPSAVTKRVVLLAAAG